jgi:hypothetical protein
MSADASARARSNGLRGAANERRAARELGSVRTARRGSKKSEQDIAFIVAGGVRFAPEAKLRKKLKTIVAWLRQAAKYGARPLVIARETGSADAIVITWAKDFCRALGIEPSALPQKATPTKRDPRQVEMFGEGAR